MYIYACSIKNVPMICMFCFTWTELYILYKLLSYQKLASQPCCTVSFPTNVGIRKAYSCKMYNKSWMFVKMLFPDVDMTCTWP